MALPPATGDRVPVAAADYEPPPSDERERRFTIPWEWWDALVIYLVWIFLASGFAVAIASTFADPESEIATATGVLVAVVLLIATTLGWLAWRGQRAEVPDAVRRAFGVKQPTVRDVSVGIGYGLVAFLVVQLGFGTLLQVLVDALGREIPPVQQGVQAAAQSSGGVAVLIGLGVVLFGPIGEELLYRGVMYQGLAKQLPAWPAIGLSGLAFGITHVEPFVIALTFPLGMLLAHGMRRHGTLVVPVVAHMVFNLIGFLLIRFAGVDAG